MTIAEVRERCKTALAKIPRDVFVVVILILSCVLSFGLGFLAGRDVGQGGSADNQVLRQTSALQEGKIVASKTGTKYYLPECPAANRISEKNKVWFDSIESAMAAGYAPAANCKGL